MTGNGQNSAGESLNLQSWISDLAQVPLWIERLATRFSIPDSTQFAINLCLEEVLSNTIRHGYAGQPGHPIAVRFSKPREDYFIFVVEDNATPFNPVESPELPPISTLDESAVGGQGIRLLRQFADALEYHRTPSGNRLILGFSSVNSAAAKN
jgi:anti-sigma regulatory factor (Ser/Thr protein kinase)